MRKRPALPILSVAIGAVPLAMWILPRWDESMKWERTHAIYDQAASFPLLNDLPRDASDINYYYAYLGTNADFLVSEKGFTEWCAARGWTPIEIQQANRGFAYTMYSGRWSDGEERRSTQRPRLRSLVPSRRYQSRLRSGIWQGVFE